MQTMSHAFGVSVGYSDHTNGITIPVAAVSMGASVIEAFNMIRIYLDQII